MLRANAATLEELRLGDNLRLDREWEDAPTCGASAASCSTAAAVTVTSQSPPHDHWNALAQCRRLRVLELPSCDASGALPDGVLAALSSLPGFSSLELSLFPKALTLTPLLFQSIALSRSWCRLHLRLLHPQAPPDLLRGGALQTQMPAELLDEATARRLRVYVHKGTRVGSYAAMRDGRGVRVWSEL